MVKGFVSNDQRKAAFARMGKDHHAMNPDIAHRAVNTLPDTPENRKIWVENSGRIDIEGIDTPAEDEGQQIRNAIDWWENKLTEKQRNKFLNGKTWSGTVQQRHKRLLSFKDEKKEIKTTRHFQKYSSDERASRMASTRLGHRQRESIGEYFYTNEVDNIAYGTKKEAIKGAEKWYDLPNRHNIQGIGGWNG